MAEQDRTQIPSIDRITLGRSEFLTHLATLVSEASQLLWLSDFAFSDWDIDDKKLVELMTQFLRENGGAKLQLLVGDPQYLASRAPRFAKLRQRMGDRIDCRQATPQAQQGE